MEDVQAHFTVAGMWNAMTPLGKGVIVVLALMSIWSLTVMISKFIQFQRTQAETRKFAPQFSRAIQEENLDQAIALAEKNKKSHVSRVLGEALAEVKPLLRDRATITAADINSAERAVERQMLITLAEFKRGTGILATVGSTAPFVGLLGTTMGIVNAFTGMATAGGGMEAISAGIAGIIHALVAYTAAIEGIPNVKAVLKSTSFRKEF